MITSKLLRSSIVVGSLIIFVFVAAVFAQSPGNPTSDELLRIVPAESLFCVRVNNLDQTLGQTDQFLTGVSPAPMWLSMIIRGHLAKLLGSPELTGVNMNGSFAVFGTIAPGEPVGEDLISILIPVTDYQQLVSENPNITQPDANGVSKMTSGPILIQVGNFALLKWQKCYDKLIETAKSISSASSAGLASVLDDDELNKAMKEPIWAHGNIQLASKTFGPLLLGKIEETKAIISGEKPRRRTKIDVNDLTVCYMADANRDGKLTTDELDQQIKKLKKEMDSYERVMQSTIEQIEQRKNQLNAMDPDSQDKLNALEQQSAKIEKEVKESRSSKQEAINRLERIKSKLTDMGPDQKAEIRELTRQVEEVKDQPNKMDSRMQENLANVMDMYAGVLDLLMKETKSLNVAVTPKSDVLNITSAISALPGTEMADMFTADTAVKQKNELLYYLQDGAVMNASGKVAGKLNAKAMDFFATILTKDMNAVDVEKMKSFASDIATVFSGNDAMSFSVDPNNKPPFAMKYVIELKDKDKYDKLIEQGIELFNTGGIADFYKNFGMETSFTIKRGVDNYKGLSIDSTNCIMKSTEPNSPQGQMINAMYGEGFEYRWTFVNGMLAAVMGENIDAAMHKLIDEVKAGGPKELASEIKSALTLIPDAGQADFVGTYNFLRWFKIIGSLMPVPTPMPKIDIPTKSNIAFAGKIGQGKMTFEIALPKEHLIEMMGMFQQMQQQQRATIGANQATAMNLRGIGKACLIYANDYDSLPTNLLELAEKNYVRKVDVLESPRKPKDFDGPSYIYISGQTTAMPPDNIVVYENPEFCSDKINVLFLDGHVEAMKPDEFLQKLEATYRRLGREMPDIKFKDATKPTR